MKNKGIKKEYYLKIIKKREIFLIKRRRSKFSFKQK